MLVRPIGTWRAETGDFELNFTAISGGVRSFSCNDQKCRCGNRLSVPFSFTTTEFDHWTLIPPHITSCFLASSPLDICPFPPTTPRLVHLSLRVSHSDCSACRNQSYIPSKPGTFPATFYQILEVGHKDPRFIVSVARFNFSKIFLVLSCWQ